MCNKGIKLRLKDSKELTRLGKHNPLKKPRSFLSEAFLIMYK